MKELDRGFMPEPKTTGVIARSLDEICMAVEAEINSAKDKWPPFNSAHEGFAVLLEEVDELKAHVWTNQKRRDLDAMRNEAIQVSAMAIRFASEVCDETSGRK